MKHLITGLEPDSVAQRGGLRVGDLLATVNGEAIIDEIDYQAMSAREVVRMDIERDGKPQTVTLHKEEWEPLGLHFGESMTLSPRSCHNKCLFCFIDQMPPNMRETLYVKDDDWRYSLMMGNFVTLTNVNDAEFERIIRRHASPLYVSVHTTNPALRCQMTNNRFAGDVMQRLTRLKDAGIRFHCQIVCCPEYNDGAELMRTLTDLRSLAPAARTVAIVPVGVTKYREHLAKLKLFDRESAAALLRMLEPFQAECRETLGTTFAFPSDEFFCLAGEPMPSDEWYEDYAQIENGVGLLRRFETDVEYAAEDDDQPADEQPHRYVLATGVSAAPHMQRLADKFAPKGTSLRVVTIRNRFFGETITVAGLLTGADVLAQLPPEVIDGAEAVLISRNMLRHERDMFLDDMTLVDFAAKLGKPVRIVDDGTDFYEALHGRAAEADAVTVPDTAGFYLTQRR